MPKSKVRKKPDAPLRTQLARTADAGAGAEPDLVPDRHGRRAGARAGLSRRLLPHRSGTDPKVPFMGDLGAWNFAVGFGVMLLGLIMAVRWR